MSTAKKTAVQEIAQEIDGHLRAIRQILHQPIQSQIVQGGLTGPQVSVLEALVRKNGQSLKDLTKSVGLAHSTLSGIVDRLEARGMVARRADPEDGRYSRIYTTAVIDDYLKNTMPQLMLSPVVRALEKVKLSERASIVKGLRLLRDAMEKP